VDWKKRIWRRLLRAAGRQAGITLIEVVIAIAIFAIVATSLIGVISSATASDGLSRQRTIALELAQQQVEYIRQLSYKDAGIDGGNPGGVVQKTQDKKVTGLWYELTTSIKYVNDPVPASYIGSANYKQVRVTVSREVDGKVLAVSTTYLSSPTRAYSGGLNNSIINVTAQDYWTHNPLPGVQIGLSKTWDPGFSAGDVTDNSVGMPTFGQVTFEGLEETPAGANPGYYDVSASLNGYTVLSTDRPPADPTDGASAAHLILARSGTTNTTIRLYKGCAITVHVLESDGTPYTAAQATVTISTQRGGLGLISQQFQTDANGNVYTDTLAGDPVVPSNDYVIDVNVPDGRHVETTGLTVPVDYSLANPQATFTVTLPVYVPPQYSTVTVEVRRSCPSGSLRTGSYYTYATAWITWEENPSDPAHNFRGSDNDHDGRIIFNQVPYETYDFSASYSSRSGSTNNVVINSPTQTVCVATG
jgi:prepilin-type N-terminal cleavage/methylation domain-containing protein